MSKKKKDTESLVEKVIGYHEKFDLTRPLTLYRQGSNKSVIELLLIIRGMAGSAYTATSLTVFDVQEGNKIKKQTEEVFAAVHEALRNIEGAAADALNAMGIENLPLSEDLIDKDE